MNRKQKRFARRIKRQARRAQVNSKEWKAVNDVCDNPAKLALLQAKIRTARLNPWQGPDKLSGMDWKDILSNLWDYIKANWPEILRLILTIAPLLLEPKHEDQ